jgi:hypothetical protein
MASLLQSPQDPLRHRSLTHQQTQQPAWTSHLEDEFNEKWERLATDTAKAVAAAESGGEPASTTPKKTRSADAKLDEVLDMLREMRFGQSAVSSGHLDAPFEFGWIGQYFLSDGNAKGRIVDVTSDGGRVTLTTDAGFRVVGTHDSLISSISSAPF